MQRLRLALTYAGLLALGVLFALAALAITVLFIVAMWTKEADAASLTTAYRLVIQPSRQKYCEPGENVYEWTDIVTHPTTGEPVALVKRMCAKG